MNNLKFTIYIHTHDMKVSFDKRNNAQEKNEIIINNKDNKDEEKKEPWRKTGEKKIRNLIFNPQPSPQIDYKTSSK